MTDPNTPERPTFLQNLSNDLTEFFQRMRDLALPIRRIYAVETESQQENTEATNFAPPAVKSTRQMADSTEVEAQLFERMLSTIDSVTTITSLSSGAVKVLLSRFRWDAAVLLESFYSYANAEEFCAKLDIKLPMNNNSTTTTTTTPAEIREEMCNICLTENVVTADGGPTCGHRFCLQCWQGHVMHSTQTGIAGMSVQCPAYGCDETLDDRFLVDVILDKKQRPQYVHWVTQRYVHNNPELFPCKCDRVLWGERHSTEPLVCECGHFMCTKCGEEWHEPITCKMMKVWNFTVQTDQPTLMWIKNRTKKCPKCSAPIEKRGGCNLMTCTNICCGQQFCWNCLQPWTLSHNNSTSCRLLLQASPTANPETNDDYEAKHMSKQMELTASYGNLLIDLVKHKEEIVKKIEQADPMFGTYQRNILDNIYRNLAIYALFFKYSYSWLYFCVECDYTQLYESHLETFREPFELSQKAFAPSGIVEDCTWVHWLDRVAPTCKKLKANYECVRDIWATGVEQNKWQMDERRMHDPTD